MGILVGIDQFGGRTCFRAVLLLLDFFINLIKCIFLQGQMVSILKVYNVATMTKGKQRNAAKYFSEVL